MADRITRTGMQDEAGVGPDPRRAVTLTPLKKLDYKVADGEPDIRGWRALTSTGRELGEIEDLLVDTKTNEVVMLDIDLKRDDRHTLAPIRAAWIDRDNKRVVINSQYLVNDEDIPALRKNRRALRADEPVVAGPAGAAAAAAMTPSDDESVRRFNANYERAYGESGWDGARSIHIEGDDELLLERPRPLTSATDESAAARPIDREVRFPRTREASAREPLYIEEHVVRRRLIDPSELDPDELERLRRESATREPVRKGIEQLPPGEERR